VESVALQLDTSKPNLTTSARDGNCYYVPKTPMPTSEIDVEQCVSQEDRKDKEGRKARREVISIVSPELLEVSILPNSRYLF
jgi:hypothetical protein